MSSFLRLFAFHSLLFLASVMGGSGAALADVSKADEIRLAYLLNFARYVTWPVDTERANFTFCVIDENVLAGRLQSATEGREISGRKVTVNVLTDSDAATNCDVLYFPAHLKSTIIDKYLNATKQKSILKVGDDASFLDKGGDIHFLVVEGTVHFEINLDNVRKNGLDMSSRLLKHAERVIEENKKKGGVDE